MHVRDALDRLDQIHEHLARAEVYREFRVPAVASVGVIAFVAAAVQPLLSDAITGIGFVWYWVIVAGACGFIGSATALHAFLRREDDFARRRTRRVMVQFLPCLVAGGAVTLASDRIPELLPLLPGLWAAIFGLGLIAASPYLPRGIGLIGLAYITSGSALLLQAASWDDPSGWAVGAVFGVGHLATAFVLWEGTKGESDG